MAFFGRLMEEALFLYNEWLMNVVLPWPRQDETTHFPPPKRKENIKIGGDVFHVEAFFREWLNRLWIVSRWSNWLNGVNHSRYIQTLIDLWIQSIWVLWLWVLWFTHPHSFRGKSGSGPGPLFFWGLTLSHHIGKGELSSAENLRWLFFWRDYMAQLYRDCNKRRSMDPGITCASWRASFFFGHFPRFFAPSSDQPSQGGQQFEYGMESCSWNLSGFQRSIGCDCDWLPHDSIWSSKKQNSCEITAEIFGKLETSTSSGLFGNHNSLWHDKHVSRSTPLWLRQGHGHLSFFWEERLVRVP